jgi:Ca2+/H+ antiporter
LGLSTALVGVTSEWLVDSINGITRTGVISEAWVGLILLPIVGNAGLYFPFLNYVTTELNICNVLRL